MKNKINLIEVIELGLNILAQDLIFKKHTEKDIIYYINQFRFRRN
jgi:hypothetical protein